MLRALGWALAHSLWQGAVLALLLLILLPRLQTARQRYALAYSTLMAVFAAAVGTFYWKFQASTPLADTNTTVLSEAPADSSVLFEAPFLESSLSASFSQWLEANLALIVAFWLLGFVFFLLRLAGGLWQIHRLKTRNLRALEAEWQEKLEALGARIGVAQSVRLFESAWVHAPLTIGWLKPAILLPIGFVNQLSFAEVEAVLAHELAHIARRDWVFNLLQAFVETLFYYHPAVWWVSQVIRRERENACDDTALTATGNPLAFARALVQVQEMATLLPTLALAMSGKRRRPLLERVRRILNQAPQQQHQVMEKITATVILLALLALVGLRANSVPSMEAALAQIGALPDAIFNNGSPENQSVSDSLPKPKGNRKITREDENGKVEVEYKNGKLNRLNIDGEEIPAAEFADHEALIEELEADIPAPPPPPAAPRVFWGAPAAPGFPAAPDAPAFPNPPFPALAPMPPLPAMPPMSSMGGASIVTDKDKDGNTIITFDNGGSTTEVVVKDGSVWIDGKEVEKGKPINLQGFYFGPDGTDFFVHAAEGVGYSFGEGNFSWSGGDAISPEQRAQMDQEMAQLQKDHARLMKEHQRNFKRDQKQAEKDFKRNQKEWEKEQKNWEKEQQNWAREQQVWQDNQQKWQAEHRAMEAKNRATQDLIKKELLRDGLITNPDKFSMRLDANTLEINNKKQSEALRKKYKELLEGASGNAFKNGGSYLYNITED